MAAGRTTSAVGPAAELELAKRVARAQVRIPIMRIVRLTLGHPLPYTVAGSSEYVVLKPEGGWMRARWEGGVLKVKPGGVAILGPRFAGTLSGAPGLRTDATQVLYRLSLAGGIDPLEGLQTPVAVAIDQADAPLWQRLLALAASAQAGNPWSRPRARAVAIEILAAILETGFRTGRLRVVDPRRPAWLSDVLVEVESRIADPSLDVAALARSAHLSSAHFALRFRQAMGKPPKGYLLQRRLERAQALLADGVASVKEVAERCGFSDVFHFSRQFKRMAGSSPTAWQDAQPPSGR
ncbi:MAG: helix-turn-helix transcriptional regulator [Planctomycetes bacterium]|nr:helix-turn-helix transcriptional regulator [Planctomycetota bacterium]